MPLRFLFHDRIVANPRRRHNLHLSICGICCYPVEKILHKRRMLVAGLHPYPFERTSLYLLERLPVLPDYRSVDVDSGPL